MSPEDYTDAVEHVAAQLTQDEFVTYFERISSAAQGFEYRLKHRAGAGKTPIVFVHANLDAYGRALVSKLRLALLFKWNGKPNPSYNATVAQAKKSSV